MGVKKSGKGRRKLGQKKRRCGRKFDIVRADHTGKRTRALATAKFIFTFLAPSVVWCSVARLLRNAEG